MFDPPYMVQVKQNILSSPIKNLKETVFGELNRINIKKIMEPGEKIAIGVGSRGIDHYAKIVLAVVEKIKKTGGLPFIFPAMGSHGGATSQGQREVLASLGIDEESMGCPINSSMRIKMIGRTDSGLPVYCDEVAFNSDWIVIVNRIKLHTDFHGPTESGLTKMLAIGLGKSQEAKAIHSKGVEGLRHEIPSVASVHLKKSSLCFGLGIIEDGTHKTSEINAIRPKQIPVQEPQLLAKSKKMMASLPVNNIDLLIVDQMGKDISGVGMDNNVLGRMYIEGESEPSSPNIRLVLPRRLTRASHGNATGIGFADLAPQQLIDEMDYEVTKVNVDTSGFPLRGKIPPIFKNDKSAIKQAIKHLQNNFAIDNPRVVRILDTLHLKELHVSENLISELKNKNGDIEILNEAEQMMFDDNGALI